MPYKDLRGWLDAVEWHGELLRISGANRDLEMSGIAEIVIRESKDPKPAILFDDIPGYPKGFRTLFGMLVSPWKIAATLGLPEDQLERMTLLQNWHKKSKNLSLIPPKFVKNGPVLANSLTGDHVDVLKLPSPLFHELDTKHYIGTACANIQRDPEGGWVNLGTYRNMVVDCDHIAFHAVEGRHGSIIQQRYFTKGDIMPIAVVVGIDPLLYWASTHLVPWGISEYEYAGGIMGEPIEVIEGPYTGLPLPANAEIVIEGECHSGEVVEEGPFGEWHGYYANLGLKTVPEPLIRVKAIHYRDDPILTCAQMAVPINDLCLQFAIGTAVGIWNRLEAMGIPGIKGVWCHEAASGDLFNVVSVEQLYAGHAQTVGLIASQYMGGGCGRYTIVVEDDIDPSNLEQVIWAIVTRVPADESIQILKRYRGTNNDPTIPMAEKMKYHEPPKPLYSAKVVINACRPLEHKPDWYPIARISPKLRTQILEKWQATLSSFVQQQ